MRVSGNYRPVGNTDQAYFNQFSGNAKMTLDLSRFVLYVSVRVDFHLIGWSRRVF